MEMYTYRKPLVPFFQAHTHTKTHKQIDFLFSFSSQTSLECSQVVHARTSAATTEAAQRRHELIRRMNVHVSTAALCCPL